MKYFPLIAIALLLAACNQPPKVAITFNANGIKNGTVILNQFNQTLLSQPIKNGTANIDQPIQQPGYYDITIIDSDKPLSSKNNFSVYLENGSYTIDTKTDAKGAYPAISSNSKTQQQLSDYYKTENEIAGELNHTVDSLLTYLDSHGVRNLPKAERSALIVKTRGYQIKRRKIEPEILSAYLSKHPENVVAAHIMAQQFIDEYPTAYNDIFKRLAADTKNSEDGQKVASKLNILVKLLPGSDAPDITGYTPDGKTFDKRSIKGKVILVEFWVSGSELSVMNHLKILNGIIINDSDKKQVGLVSISTDTKQDVWKRAIKNGKLTWPQVADFKGDNSPNVANWKITAVPGYFLVDEHWRIIEANIALTDVDSEVHEYLTKQSK